MLKPLRLKNGMTVLRLPKQGSGVFLTSFVATSGSVVEEGYFPLGISYLIERLFWCGTDKHTSSRSLNLTLESMGGTYSSQTTQELSQFYINVPSYHQFKAISMMAEVIQRSYFDTRDIDREKRAIVEDLKTFEDIIDADHTRLAMSNLYAKYNLGLPVEGTIDSIMSITQEDVNEYLAHQYRPDKSFLVMSGNFDNKAVMELVEQEWNYWSPRLKKYIEPFEFHKDDVDELPRVVYRQRGLAQTQIAFAFLLDEGMQSELISEASKNPEITIDTKVALEATLTKWAQLLVLNSVLGQGSSSRLWSKTVEEEMLFANVGSEVVRFKATGYLQISGTIDNSQFSFGLESVLSTLEGLKKTTVSINELLKAKEYLKGKLIIEHEDLLIATSWQVENLVGSNLTFELQDLLTKIDQVEAPAIRSLASDLFTASRAAITTLGTAKETRLVDKLIRKYLS